MIAIWFGVVGLMLIAYVVLDGRNFGAGMLHLLVARTREERRQVIAAIGPLWSWHEVWLIGFGGVLFAAFPRLLASAFAGYYLALMLILWCLILRGMALEVGGHINDPLWQGFWDVVFAIASALLAVLFGVAAGNLARGVPLDAEGNFSLPFFTDFGVRGQVGLLDWYTVSVGVFAVVVLAAHGATYLTLTTDGAVHDRSERWARRLWAAALPLLVLISVESWLVRPDLRARALTNPLWWSGVLVVLGAAMALISGLFTRRETRAFLGSNFLLVGLLAAGGAALYPEMLHSTLAPENSLTAAAVAAGPRALAIATVWWPVSFMLTIAYFVLISRRYVGKVSVQRTSQASIEADMPAQLPTPLPRVVIVGGGFGGLAAAKALRRAPVEVILVDRNNHHLFQPLLYQVATAVLAPGQVGSPIRGILAKQRNATVILGEVTGVNTEHRYIVATSADRRDVPIQYDYLILATGVSHSYFGHDEFAPFAPGLKTLADGVAVRNRILQAFEQAEAEEDPSRHRDLLTFVLVGAGPTGVEMAGALAVLVRTTLRSEYRRIDPRSARIVLVDMAPRVLGTFKEILSAAAKRHLEHLGVELRLGHAVDQIDAEGVVLGGERIASKTVIWTAGVAPSPAGKWLGAEMDRAGRVKTQPNLSVPGHPEVFVVGDTSSHEQRGKPLPGVAQVAMQEGRYAGKLICRRVSGKAPPRPFSYFDKGNMAVVGKGYAVLQSAGVRISGFVAWLAWAAVHLQFLATSSLRVSVFLQWVWTFLTDVRASRLIIRHHGDDSTPVPAHAPAAAPAPRTASAA